MDIRELNSGDIEKIKKLMLDIFSGEPWNDVWTDKQLHAYVSELIENKNSLSFGVYLDGNLIGMALGRTKSWYEGTEYWIEEFGILPDRQQSGTGSAFIKSQVSNLSLNQINSEPDAPYSEASGSAEF